MKVFRGRLVHSLKPEKIEILEDAVIGYSERDGKIHFVEKYASNIEQLMQMYGFCDSDVQLLTEGQFLMPGFVDAHVHAAQHQISRAMEKGETLIEWLKRCVYPLEEKFSDIAFAHNIYDEFVRRTLHCGSTTVNYFGTIYLESTKELCQVVEKYGQRALVGKVNMDTHSGKYVETTEKSLKDTLEFIDFVRQMKGLLVQPVITPRFLASCTESLLTQLAKIAIDNGLRIQSFFCEEKNEIEYILSECHTDGQSCTEIMDSVGLLNDKAFMIHANILEENELQLFKKRDTGVIHCPTTNLSQGIYTNVRDRLSRGLKVALGSDYCWGACSSSILDIMRDAKNVSMIVKKQHVQAGDHEYEPLTIDELFYMATLGGAKVLSMEDQIGNFEVDKQFDALLVDMNNMNLPLMSENIVEDFLQFGTDKNIVNVFVAGKQVVPFEVEKTLEDNEITRDIYEKYSQEDGVIPFKAVKWIIIGPPEVGKTTTKMRLLKQIHNIKTEIKGGNMRPDSTCIEKPVEVICTTMISANETENNLYWKPLNESQLDQAVMCYINSSTVESSSFQNHKQSQTPNSIDTMPTELAEIDANNVQTNKYKTTEELLILQSRKRSHDFESSHAKFKKQAWTFENDDNDFSQNHLPYEENNKEQLLIFQSRKRSHSPDSIADTMLKKQATFFDSENDNNEFLPNIEELLVYNTTDTRNQPKEPDNMEIEHSTLFSKKKERRASTIVMNFVKKQCNDKDFFKLIKEIKDSVSSSTSIYITDTGGQPEFLRLLPLILSKPAFYFVFFSLAQQLDQTYAVKFTKEGETQTLYQSTQTVKDILSQLLFSLHIPTSRDDEYSEVKSRALLFGTNADHPYKDVDEISYELKEILPLDSNYVTSVESKFKTVFIPVNNMDGTEDEIISIRQYLEELVNNLEPVNIPVRWLIFHLLLRKRFKEAKVCSLKACEQLAKECFIVEDDVQAILVYIHENMGTILYYRDIDRNVIVCVPDVLLKIISELVVVSVIQSPSTEDKVTDVSTHGEIHEEFLNSLMDNKEVYGQLDAQYVIKVMRHFQLITTLTEKDSINNAVHDSAPLFAPSLLRPDQKSNQDPTDHDVRTTLLVSFGNDEMPPHLFQNLIVALRAQSMEIEKKDSQLMWSLSHDHSRYSDHIYFKVSYCKKEGVVELQLKKLELAYYIEVRYECLSHQSIQYFVLQNVKKVLHLVCDTFPHTRHIKPVYGAYCWSNDNLHFSEYNEEKSTFLCRNCVWDKSEVLIWFQPSEEMEEAITKDAEVQFEPETTDVEVQYDHFEEMDEVISKDAEVQFDYFCPIIDNFKNVYIAGQKLFIIQGDHFQSFHWDECGLRLSCPKGALSSSDERCEVAIVALAGGQFKLPEKTKLVSAVYGISVSKNLLKPLNLKLQHCVALETKDQAEYLKFVRAPLVGCDPNTEFTILEGGEFRPGSWYGSITRYHFCKVGVVQAENSVEQCTGTNDVNEYTDHDPLNIDTNDVNVTDHDPPSVATNDVNVADHDPLNVATNNVNVADYDPLSVATNDVNVTDHDPLSVATNNVNVADHDPLSVATNAVNVADHDPLSVATNDVNVADHDPLNVATNNVNPLNVATSDVNVADHDPLNVATSDVNVATIDVNVADHDPFNVATNDVNVANHNPLNVATDSVNDVNTAVNRVAYFCKIYYESISPLVWSVKLSIVRRLNALEEYMKRKQPKADPSHYFDFVLPSGNFFKFDLNTNTQNPPQGWSIYQLTENPEFEYKFIDKFVSDELPEPPSCLVKVYARQSPDTEEIFHYPVPLAGVTKPEKITIHLSLRSNPMTDSMTSILTSTTLNPVVVKRALVQCTVNIVESSVDPFALARRLYSNEIIGDNFYKRVRDSETRDSMEDRLEKILDHLKDLAKNDASILIAFLDILSDLGRDDLTDTIKKKYLELQSTHS